MAAADEMISDGEGMMEWWRRDYSMDGIGECYAMSFDVMW